MANTQNSNQVPRKDELSRLTDNLDALLDMLKQGNWDQISDLEVNLISALDAVRTPALLAEKKVSRKQVEVLLSKLELAIRECSVRKEQIAPLVNALSPTKRSSANP